MYVRTRARAMLVSAGVLALSIAATVVTRGAAAPEDAFQYNIIGITHTSPGEFPVVTFSVTDPTRGHAPYDVLGHPAFLAPNGVSRLAVLIAWDTRDYTNTGSGVATGAALPISIDALRNASRNPDGTFSVVALAPIPLQAGGSGAVAIEGHPAADLDGDGLFETAVQERSVFRSFAITDARPVDRRKVVEVAKCTRCHVPHLSLHGSNRTDEPQVCVMCHNPNQTDIPFRTSGAEVPVDFKYMVHAIHGSSIRRTPYVVVGRNGTVHDYSAVRFPRSPRNCLTCHVDGTFELPLKGGVLGTTIATGSGFAPAKTIDRDPANDLKITPTAAVCSSCHDDRETRQHMTRHGARFGVVQGEIDSGRVRERCADCHGRGKKRDVRKEHDL